MEMSFVCEALTLISTCEEDKLDILVEFHTYADLMMPCLLIDLNLQNILVNQLSSNQIPLK